MKYLKFCLVLFALTVAYNSAMAQGSLGTRLNLQNPNDVASQANRKPPVGGDNGILSNPYVNASLNGYANMVQGAVGNINNFYAAEEQRKQQAEYSKQQIQNADN